MQITIDIPAIDELMDRLERIEKLLQPNKLPQKQKEWCLIKEAADYLNMSVSSVRKLIDRRLLERALDSYRIRIPRESLEA